MLKDVIVHKIVFDEENNKGLPAGLGNAHTHGMENYGLKNLCMGIEYDDNRASYIFNTIAELMVDPNEDMDINKTHCIDNEYGITSFKFRLREATCFEEPVFLIIVADVNGKFPEDCCCLEPNRYQLMNHHEIVVS